MFGKPITLFKMFGFAVRIDWSWLIIMGLVVWSLSAGVFPQQYPDQPNWLYVVMGFGGAAGLFLSIVFHELCHSLIARRYNLPIRGITLFLFGGVAEMTDEPESPKAEFFMAIAGPVSSLLVAAIFFGVHQLSVVANWHEALRRVFIWVAALNVILAIFNMIPGFPLDGGRVLRSIIWHFTNNLRRATHIASRIGSGFGLVLVGLGIFTVIGGNWGGVWSILIGLFIRNASKQGYQQVLIRQSLEGEPVRRFMNDQPVTVPPDKTVQELVDDYIYRYHFKLFPVVEDDRLVGCVTLRQVRDIPRDAWSTTRVEQIASECDSHNTVPADMDAMHALGRMNESQVSRFMVVQNDRLVGIVALRDLLKFLSLKMELEDRSGQARPGGVLPGQRRSELPADESPSPTGR